MAKYLMTVNYGRFARVDINGEQVYIDRNDGVEIDQAQYDVFIKESVQTSIKIINDNVPVNILKYNFKEIEEEEVTSGEGSVETKEKALEEDSTIKAAGEGEGKKPNDTKKKRNKRKKVNTSGEPETGLS